MNGHDSGSDALTLLLLALFDVVLPFFPVPLSIFPVTFGTFFFITSDVFVLCIILSTIFLPTSTTVLTIFLPTSTTALTTFFAVLTTVFNAFLINPNIFPLESMYLY